MFTVRLAALVVLLVGAGCKTIGPDEWNNHKHRAQRELPPSHGTRHTPAPDEYYAFTAFHEPDFGFYLATSRDGYAWTPVNENRAIFVPRVEDAWGMRDPCIAQGPDGVFHMVWTWHKGGRGTVGYANSRDLTTWSPARALRLMPPEPTFDGVWAPEIYHADGQWLIAWSSQVEGKFAETATTANANHRLYFTTTTDFTDLAPARLYYDPGFPCIDPAWIRVGDTFYMFFKDERQWPEKKQLRVATAPSVFGPWSEASTALTIHWVEAPSVIRIGDHVIVYFDEYTKARYGAIRSADLKAWHDVSRLMSFPKGHRHGSVIRISPALGRTLETFRSPARAP